jgi:hypothetical protein
MRALEKRIEARVFEKMEFKIKYLDFIFEWEKSRILYQNTFYD